MVRMILVLLVVIIPTIVFAGGGGDSSTGVTRGSISMHEITDYATAQSKADALNANRDMHTSYGVEVAYDFATGTSGYSVGEYHESGDGDGGNGIGGNTGGNPDVIPTASLDCSPDTTKVGNPVVLKWTCTDAISSSGTNFSTGGYTVGHLSVFPIQDTTYTVRCSGTAIYMEASCTVKINTDTCTGPDCDSDSECTGPDCDNDTECTGPDCNNDTECTGYDCDTIITGGDTSWLDCFPRYITSGEKVRLRWNCVGATGSTLRNTSTNTIIYDGSQTNGFEIEQPITTTDYRLDCDGTGQSFACTTHVIVTPTANIQASKTLVRSGQESRITWSSVATTGCKVSGPGLSSTDSAGSELITILGESIFKIECDGDVNDSVKVRIVPIWQEI
jgi:hypothetical protein